MSKICQSGADEMSSKEPEIIVINEGALEELRTLLKDYDSPLCVTDELVKAEYSHHLEEVVGSTCKWLMANKYRVDSNTILGSIDIVLGFGGGSSLDIAKLVARDTGLNWISIPTAASHDGIASEVASVSHNGHKYSVKCKAPLAVIADTSIMALAPPILKLAGLGDIICKTSSLAEWKMAHENMDEVFDESVYSIVENALKSVLNDDSLETLIKAEIDAGRAMSIFGSSRPCSGTEHAISHAMDNVSGELHGLQVAFATPLCLHYLNEVGYTSYKPDDVLEFMSDRKMPTTLIDMSITSDQFIKVIQNGLDIMEKRERYSVLRHKAVDESSLRKSISQLGY
ncbi:MAG: iron-containing alcohol dehydrogenase [Candidatus Thorarchaeota archaeon]